MRNRTTFSALRLISLVLLILALILIAMQLVRFSRVRANLPSGLKVASVPVGTLDRQMAAQRLLEVYSYPVELRYNGAPIQMSPNSAEFQLDIDKMLAIADMQRTQRSFWVEFWDFIWGRATTPVSVPLSYTSSEARLKLFLEEIAQRYDIPPVPAQPLPGTVNFEPGASGSALDMDGAVLLIENALTSLTNRTVDLPIKRTSAPRPAFQTLDILLQQTIKVSEFDGLVGVYLLDLQNAQELHFAYRIGELLPVEPDIAFTASSIIKIPIMVSVFQRVDDPDEETLKLMEDMVDRSGNEAADWLMDRVMEPGTAPLNVSEDMKTLGLENTFLAGYFSAGSPLLQAFQTPSNQRTDVNTDPDRYSQTTPSDIGMLLVDLYQCAENGGGALMSAYPGTITQAECQAMVQYLVNNRLPSLLTAGLPEGTKIAHKHGWVSTNGIINTVGDAGIVYSPGGNYVLVVFVHHPDQVIWDSASTLIAMLSQAVYNFYNLPNR
jgi:beta-lactamase class A